MANRGWQNILGKLLSAVSSVDGQPEDLASSASALLVADQSNAALEYPNSAVGSVLREMPVARRTIVNLQTAIAVGGSAAANDTWLLGIEVVKALTGTCVIAGFADQTGAAQNITLPAATPVGKYLDKAAKNTAGPLTVTCSNVADALNVVVHYWNGV